MGCKLLTKVASGVAFGDVSNYAVRNILTELSKIMSGKFTEQEMEDTMEAFDWKCPYTGRDLKKSIKEKDGSYAVDHVCPQNREFCGLNVKGNLIVVDKKANAAKHNKDVETFLMEDQTVLCGVDEKTRLERLDKIKKFQKDCGYDPEKIRLIVSPLLNKIYDDVRAQQESRIDEILEAVNRAGVGGGQKTMSELISVETVKRKTAHRKGCIELVFYPENEQMFKEKLLQSKKAHFVLTYDSGVVKQVKWDAKNFEETSNLKGNIQSKTFWRYGKTEGLIKVEAYVD